MAETYQYSEIGEAADAVREHIILNQNNLPEHVRERLVALTRTGSSPVDLIVDFVKAVYANSADFDTDTKRKTAAAAELIGMKGFHAGLDGRAGAIADSFRRETGLKAPAGRSWPSKADDPPVDAAWIEPKPVEEAPAAGTGQ